MIRNKLMMLGLSGVMAAGLMSGAAAALAQTNSLAVAPPAAMSSIVLVHNGGSRLVGADGAALASALGITVEELDAAQEAARVALIDQAVADGHLTEAEGEALKLGGGRLHSSQYGYDKDEFLADALGITVDELNAAELSAYETEIAAAVEAGTLTQEQADLLLARRAAQIHLDQDALDAAVQSAYEDAVAAAVAAGDITQAQADALLAQLATQTLDFGFGGRGGHGGWGGPGGRGGFGLNALPDAAPETTPDTTTDTAFDA